MKKGKKVKTLVPVKKQGKDLSPALYDPLKAYISEISQYPVLKKEEEEALIQKVLNGNMDAAKKLLLANLRLVVKIAFEYKSAYQNVMDLIQEGNIGLMKAISLYNPDKGAKLSYYASWWIRSYILKFLIDNFRLVKIGTTQAQKKLFYNLIQEKDKLEMQGKIALPLLLSENLAVKEKEIIEMSNRLSGGAEVSLDQPMQNDDDEKSTTVLSTYADNSQRPDLIVEEEEYRNYFKQKLNDFAITLNEKEKMILHERLLSEAPFTLQNIADHFGISKERARQLENRIMSKLKDFLNPRENLS